MRSGKSIPTKFLYWTDDACHLWIETCNEPEYRFYRDSLIQLKEIAPNIATEVLSSCGNTSLDLISLGCGDGKKDAILLSSLVNLLKNDGNILYYPVDINATMIVEALRAIARFPLEMNKLETKAIIGDISCLDSLKPIYEYRNSPNIFSILGNTLGNNSEEEILSSLDDGMFSGDFLLIEFSAASDPLTYADFEKLGTTFKYPITPQGSIPLTALGSSYDPERIDIVIKKNISIIPHTKTIVLYYEKILIDGTEFRQVKLSSVHIYNENSFQDFIEKRLDVKTLFFSCQRGIGLLLARRN